VLNLVYHRCHGVRCWQSLLHIIHCSLLTSFPARGKKRGMEKGESEQKLDRKKYWDLEGVAFPSFLSHSGAGLDSFDRYARPPIKTHEAWVYGGDETQGLLCAGGPCVSRTCGGILGVLCGIL
jgi:hypothetical protein